MSERPEALLLRPVEAAALLSMSRSRVYELAQAGELPGVVRLGGSVRIHRPTLEAWLADQATNRVTAPALVRPERSEGARVTRRAG